MESLNQKNTGRLGGSCNRFTTWPNPSCSWKFEYILSSTSFSCPEWNIGEALLSYQEIAHAFTHLLHNHTSSRTCNGLVKIRKEEPAWWKSANSDAHTLFNCWRVWRISSSIPSGFPGFCVWKHRRNGAAQPVNTDWTQRNKLPSPQYPMSCGCLQHMPSPCSPLHFFIRAFLKLFCTMHVGVHAFDFLNPYFHELSWPINMHNIQRRRLWRQVWPNVPHKTNYWPSKEFRMRLPVWENCSPEYILSRALLLSRKCAVWLGHIFSCQNNIH